MIKLYNQLGFISDMQGWLNFQKAINITILTGKREKNHMTV